jgi:AhpD family alkylhydroperoxidase
MTEPRMNNPVMLVPGAMEALQQLSAATRATGVPEATLYLVEMRASQINGCSVCLDMHSREMKAAGEAEERVALVAAWRETRYFSDAERAALALTEAVTRLADHPESISDEIWEEASRHYDELQLAGLVLTIAGINAWNRINASTQQITGAWVEQWIHRPQPIRQSA